MRALAAPSDIDEAAFIVDVVEGPRRRRRRAVRGRACSIARTRSRGCSSTRCSTRRCRTASTAACASSSAPRSSTRSPTCASSRRPIDDGAFLRIVNFPPRGIGARTLETLQDAARGAGHEPVAGGVRGGKVGGKAGASLAAFVRLIEAHARGDRRPAAARGGRARQRRVRPARALPERRRTGRTGSTISTSSSTPRGSFLREADLAVDAPMLAPGRRRRRRPPRPAPPIR